MPHLPHSIELHDSRLAEIRREGGAVVLRLSPAYIHRNGKGYGQVAELIIGEGDCRAIPIDLPARISDGNLKTANAAYDNLLPLPFHDLGPVALEMALESGVIVLVSGTSAKVKLFGEERFIEDVA